MVTREERQIELIEKREQYDREQVKGSEDAQKARERMIKEKLIAIGVEPTQERIQEDSDFIDRVLLRIGNR